jgi:ParB family transcriptional regulator, chromosome partitioning protein
VQQTLKLSQLHHGSALVNVRQTGRQDRIEELAASIDRLGVILPLAVKANGDGTFNVIDGDRRLTALHLLKKQKKIDDNYEVPALVHAANDTTATAMSLAANIASLPLHPVDQYEAFKALSETMTEQEIAATYSLKPKQVKQVLALGSLSDKVRAAWRDNKIDAETAKAFTIAEPARQDEILSEIKGHVSAYAVRSKLTANAREVGRMLKFVGAKAYEKAGGVIKRDLFGDDDVVSDEALLIKLTDEKLAGVCEKLQSHGWSWAKVEAGNERFQMRSITPTLKWDEADTKKRKELEAKIKATKKSGGNEFFRLQTEMRDLEEDVGSRSFTEAQMSKSGCLVSIDHHGELRIQYGMMGEGAKRSAEDLAPAEKKKRDKQKSGAISNALAQRLSEQLSAALSEALVWEPNVALSALLAAFETHEGKPLDVRENGLAHKKSGMRTIKRSFEKAFAEYAAMSKTEQLQALANVAALAIDVQTFNAEAPPLKSKASAALFDALKWSRLRQCLINHFDAEDYCNSVSKPQCLKVIEDCIGKERARQLATKPKSDVAAAAIEAIKKTSWLPTELRTARYPFARRS